MTAMFFKLQQFLRISAIFRVVVKFCQFFLRKVLSPSYKD